MKQKPFRRHGLYGFGPAHQKGALTMFSAVLILILLTEMIIYAVQVGVFEQRKSSNEMRQKESFHLADSAIQFGKEFMLANGKLVASAETDLLVDGSDGWLSASGLSWRSCEDADLDAEQGEHPCFAEPADNGTDFPADLRNNMYFYTTDPTGDPDDLSLAELPIDLTGVITDDTQQVRLYALLCMLDLNRANADLSPPQPIVEGCTTLPGEQDDRYFMITLLSRGEADCDGGTCSAKSLISDKIGSFGPGGGEGGPGAPLTSKSTLPESSSTDIVPNPNGGGEGVPVSVWIDANAEVDGLSGNAWATCERHEWYEVDMLPEDGRCPTPSHVCTCHGKKQISHGESGQDQHLGIDIIFDSDFPPDLFSYTFGVTGDAAGVDYVRGLADEIVPNCDGLSDASFGLIWVEGECNLNGNVLIGTIKAPVLLVLAGGPSTLNGGVEIFGTIFVTDVANVATNLRGSGNLTIYGAIMADADISQFGGNLKLVYLEDVLKRGLQTGGFGTVAGAWSDFHSDWR